MGLEISSLGIYTLIALRNNLNSIQSAIKYFSMGVLSCGFYAMSVALLYLLTGHFEIDKILNFLFNANLKESALLFGASVFLFAFIAFKLSLVPFHTWIVNVYDGASSPLVGYISVVPKIVAFVIMIRFFSPLCDINFINIMICAVAILSITLGNIAALIQEDVKKCLHIVPFHILVLFCVR